MSDPQIIETEVRRASDLGPILARVREDRKMRQGDLAESLGFSRTYLAGLESGRSATQVARLFRVLRALGITVTLSFAVNAQTLEDD